MTDITPLTLLGESFGFSPTDLKDNRTGKLSFSQRQRLTRRFLNALAVGLLLLLAPPIVAMILVSWGDGGSVSEILGALEVVVGLVIGLVLAGFFVVASMHLFVLALDLAQGVVRSVTGPVQRQGMYLRIGRRRFLVEEATLDLIQSGLKYTFYYLPRSSTIVSVEFAE